MYTRYIRVQVCILVYQGIGMYTRYIRVQVCILGILGIFVGSDKRILNRVNQDKIFKQLYITRSISLARKIRYHRISTECFYIHLNHVKTVFMIKLLSVLLVSRVGYESQDREGMVRVCSGENPPPDPVSRLPPNLQFISDQRRERLRNSSVKRRG